MKNLILTLIITLCAVTTFAQPAQYTPMTAAGYQMKRLKVDSTLHLPSFCGVPTIRGSVAKEGALAIDTCGGLLYMWTRTAGWDTVNTSGGGGSSTDTTSLSNRINLKIDSLKRSNDSVYAFINGVKIFQFTDSVGGGSTDTTSLSNRINLKIDSLKRSNDSVYAFINGTRVFQFKDSVGGGGGDFWKTSGTTDLTGNVLIQTDNNIQFNGINGEIPNFNVYANKILFNTPDHDLRIVDLTTTSDTSEYKPLGISNLTNKLAPLTSWVGGGGGDFWKTSGTTTLSGAVNISSNGSLSFLGDTEDLQSFGVNANQISFAGGNYQLGALSTIDNDTTTYKPLAVDASGNILKSTSWVSGGGGVAVDTIFRTLGKDSIFYKKNNITYAIKDSVGTNPPASGYYGAFQDTTTQTAALINTAYGVKLGVTDLSNGVTISNNTRIKIANAGIYNIQFSLQLEKTGGSGNMIADIWLRKNGVNLDGTTGKVVLTGSTNASPIVAAWNYLVAVSSNDSLELMWATTNDNVVIKASPATSPFPSIPSAILTVTQQSGIMAGTGISPLDTANMLLPYLRKADTTAFQRKSIPSYTFLANNTTATANAQALPFKDTSGVYTLSPAWSTSAPTGTTNHTYRWTRIGNMVTLNISLVYGTVSSNNTSLTIPLPTDCPTPVKPTGLTAASNFLYTGSCNGGNTLTTAGNLSARGGLRSNAANNGFEIGFTFTGNPFIFFQTTVTYYTN